MRMEAFSCEYVGREISVTRARNPLYLSVQGLVMDETKNTFVIRTKEGDRRIPKNGNTFRIETASEKFEVAGNTILYTVEDRIRNASKLARLAKRMRH